jgi:hypothetical protein
VAFTRKFPARHRTVAGAWQRLAGELAVAADFATQGANAARRRDAKALSASIDHLRLVVFDAARFHTANHEHLDKEPQS